MTDAGHLRYARLPIDARTYNVQILRKVSQPPQAPRLVVVAYQPNQLACDVLRVCIRSLQVYTTIPHELWIIDNNSPWNHTAWLLDEPNINLVLSRTTPLPPEGRGLLSRFSRTKRAQWRQLAGSYANAIGLELGVRVIDPESHYLMTLHMDTMACHAGWLPFLQSKLTGHVRAAGVRMDTVRNPQGVLHVLGYLVDFQLFRRLELDFLPALPHYDVGDRVTIALREHGYDVFACLNTLGQPDLIEMLPQDSPLRGLQVDRAFDDSGNVIFLHLGRGLRKTAGKHRAGTTPEQWIQFAEEHLLS